MLTYMTASFLKVASFSLTPSSLKSLFPPPPFIPPLRWAPGLLFHAPVTVHSALHLFPMDTRVAALVVKSLLGTHPLTPVKLFDEEEESLLGRCQLAMGQ